MTVKQFELIKAYKATETLKDNDHLSESVLWNLYRFRKALSPYIEYQREREKALLDKYLKYADDSGSITGEPYQNYIKEIQEIAELGKEFDWEPIELPTVQGLTISMMEDLDNFISFKQPE